MFNLILALAALGVVLYVVGISVYKYKTTPGTHLMTAFHDSLSILWSRVLALSGALVGFLISGADYLGDPELADAIKGILKPEYVPFLILGIAIITNLARRRTLPPEDKK